MSRPRGCAELCRLRQKSGDIVLEYRFDLLAARLSDRTILESQLLALSNQPLKAGYFASDVNWL